MPKGCRYGKPSKKQAFIAFKCGFYAFSENRATKKASQNERLFFKIIGWAIKTPVDDLLRR